eukprot:TRINITY_DN67924_c3_g1_i1.p1 TRINITY_DN67924_c3_g1~~TRINITY_DN67924_c3_g1_i1.p1  ORF type:complete len:830 (-),score=45.78 TRINITY_DN67924_c3_g1_i1:105-2252(-)
MLKIHPREQLLRWHFYLIERQRQRYKLLGTNRVSIVCDIAQLGFGIITNTTAMGFLKEVTHLDQNLFPENMRYMFIINAPSVFSTLWNILKSYLDERVRQKIHILKKNYLEYLVPQYMDIDQVPIEFGGKGGHWETMANDPASYVPPPAKFPEAVEEKHLAPPEPEVTTTTTTTTITTTADASSSSNLVPPPVVGKTSTPEPQSSTVDAEETIVYVDHPQRDSEGQKDAPIKFTTTSSGSAVSRPESIQEELHATMSFHSVHSRESSFCSQYGYMEPAALPPRLGDDESSSSNEDIYPHTPELGAAPTPGGPGAPMLLPPTSSHISVNGKLTHQEISGMPPKTSSAPLIVGGTTPAPHVPVPADAKFSLFIQAAMNSLGYTVLQCVYEGHLIAETHHNMIVTRRDKDGATYSSTTPPGTTPSSPTGGPLTSPTKTLPAASGQQALITTTTTTTTTTTAEQTATAPHCATPSSGSDKLGTPNSAPPVLHGNIGTPLTPTTGDFIMPQPGSTATSGRNRDEYVLAGSFQGEDNRHMHFHQCVQLYDGEKNLRLILRKRKIHKEIQIFFPSFSSVTRTGPLIKGFNPQPGDDLYVQTPTSTTSPGGAGFTGTPSSRSLSSRLGTLFPGTNTAAQQPVVNPAAPRQDPAAHPPERLHVMSCHPAPKPRDRRDWIVKSVSKGEVEIERTGNKITWGASFREHEPEFIFLLSIALSNLWYW